MCPRCYLKPGSDQVETFTSKYMSSYLARLKDANVAVRRGYAQALGALPAWLLVGSVDEVGVGVHQPGTGPQLLTHLCHWPHQAATITHWVTHPWSCLA